MTKRLSERRAIKNLFKIQEYKKDFIFEPNICTKEDLIKNFNKKIKITHKVCKTKTSIKLSDWLYEANLRLEYLKTNNLEFLCPKCLTNLTQKIIDKKDNDEFIIKNIPFNIKEPITVYHKKCKKTFEKDLRSLLSKTIQCKVCQTKNKEAKRKSVEEKQKWFLEKLKHENLDSFIPQEKYIDLNSEILFLHKTCGETFRDKPKNLIRRARKCPLCDCSDKIQPLKEGTLIKNNISKYHKDFEFKGLIDDNPALVELKHTICGKTFTDYKKKVYSDKLECPFCKNDKITKNNFISLSDKIELYEKKLNYEFKILEGFTTQKDIIKVKKNSCGHTFERSLHYLLTNKDSVNCPECDRLNRLKELEGKLAKKYNDRFIALDGVDNYKNNQSSLLFLDKTCGEKFKSSFTSILNKKDFNCPRCEGNKNTTSSIKSEVYQKFKGEYLMLGEYIDSKTPILFKHTTCNHVFFKTKYKFFNSKIPCKECAKQNKSLGLEKAQIKANKKFGKLFTLKGIYKNNTTKLPVICNSCNQVEEISIVNLIKRDSCSNCKASYL